MDQQTRYRVTGSLFLLALAIICLPMLFDGEGVASIDLEPLPVALPPVQVRPLADVAPRSDFIERVDDLRASVDSDGYQVDTSTRIGEPVLSEPEPGSEVWAVQVAAFAVTANAVKLREELRSSGYEAFISNYRTSQGVRARVAVGPLLSRAEADRLRDELAQQFEQGARVVAFSN